MRGLKTEENDKSNRFWNIVEQTAQSKGAVFFCECGEGREFFLPDIEGEDVSGWLIPEADADEFEEIWKTIHVIDDTPRKWDKFLRLAKWSIINNQVKVTFID